MPTRVLELAPYVSLLGASNFHHPCTLHRAAVFMSIGRWKKILILKRGSGTLSGSRHFVIVTTWRLGRNALLTSRRSYVLSEPTGASAAKSRSAAAPSPDRIL